MRADDPRPVINLVNVNNGGVIREAPFTIMGSITATTNFQDYRIEWGKGKDPEEWHPLFDWRDDPAHSPQEIYTWDIQGLETNVITFKVIVRSTIDTRVEKTFTMSVDLPAPTPTATATTTPTDEPIILPSATPTIPPLPTETPETPPSETPEPTLLPKGDCKENAVLKMQRKSVQVLLICKPAPEVMIRIMPFVPRAHSGTYSLFEKERDPV